MSQPGTQRKFLHQPVYEGFIVDWKSYIFVALFAAITLFVFLAVQVGNGYQSVAVSSQNYTQTSFLWYEHLVHIAPSWNCQSSVIERGQGSIPAILF